MNGKQPEAARKDALAKVVDAEARAAVAEHNAAEHKDLGVIQTHLTPLGFAMLLARFSIAAQIKHDLIFAYDDCRNQLDYANDGVWHARPIETEIVDRWIWGCSLQ